VYEIGTATDHIDLLTKLNVFLTKGSAFGVAYTGTGNGLMTAWAGGASTIAETFTITATSATAFSVVGSISGSLGSATVGTPFSHAKLTFLISAGGTAFIVGDAFTLATAPPWQALRSPVTATATRWRLNVQTTVGAAPIEIGEMELMDTHGGPNLATGGTASASSGSTAANAFDGSNSTRAILTGASGWLEYALGTTKAIKEVALTLSSATGAGTSAMPKDFTLEYFNGTTWVIVGSYRNETAWGVGERRVFRLSSYIWQAPGNDNASQIIVGVHPFENAGAGWYDWRLNGYTAYDASADFFTQPGSIKTTSPYGPVLPLSNASLGYWFIGNGRRVIVVVKSGSTYGAAYLGLIHPYASPGQWPYPLFVGGSLYFDLSSGEPVSTSNLWLVGTAHAKHTTFVLPFVTLPSGASDFATGSSARLRKPDGSWLAFLSRSDFYDLKIQSPCGTTWPYAYGFSGLKPDLDGKYSLFPVVLFERAPDNAYGQLDGVHAVTGSGLSAEAAIAIGRDNYVAFPDVTRGGAGDFFAVRLD
jgi:hypothetical protein